MVLIKGLLVFAVLAAGLHEAAATTNKIVCYFGSWSVYRYGNGKFDVENIEPTLCTHLIFTFLGLSDDGKIRILDAYNELEDNWGKGAYKRFVNLKQRSPGVKTMIAIGGWNEGSERYSRVFANDALRKVFVDDTVAFLKKFNFDGFDLDWEYPNQRGGNQQDVVNYIKLIKELRQAFTPHGYLLTAAVAAAETSMSLSYNVPEMSKHLDFINVMAYDLHGSWEPVTGHNAPLYPSSKDVTDTQKQLNVKACIENWIRKGADPGKLVLGMGTYGRSFTLNNPSVNGIGASASNPGNGGPYTNQNGFMGYNEIVELQKRGGWTVVWDSEQQIPYAYSGNQWIGYDDPRSITLKCEFAKSMKLGGAMIWSIETDDFLGLSGTKFALLEAINSALKRHVPDEPTPAPVKTTTTDGRTTKPHPMTTAAPITTTTPGSDMSYLCHKVEFVRDPVHCDKFYYCIYEEGRFKAVAFQCSNGLWFDTVHCVCNYPAVTKCP